MAGTWSLVRRRGLVAGVTALVAATAASVSLGVHAASAASVPGCTSVASASGPLMADDGRTYLAVVSATATATIPAGVTSVTVDACGAQGAGAAGGLGGRTVTTVPATAGTTLTIVAGSRDGSIGGGGSAGTTFAGGGYSGAFTGTPSQAAAIVVAGGGGGASTTGAAGGAGGSMGAAGADDVSGLSLAGGGKGGTQQLGGAFGTGSQAGAQGGALLGGDGGVDLASGGGGGGGYNGGGGGAASRAVDATTAAGGGGGGASYLSSAAQGAGSTTTGVRSGAGAVVLSYVAPPVPSASASPSPSSSATASPAVSPGASTAPSSPAPSASPSTACRTPQVHVNTRTINATGLASVTVVDATPGAEVILQGYSQNHAGTASFANDPTPVDRSGVADANGFVTFDDLRPPSNTRLRARQVPCAFGDQTDVINVRAQEALTVTRSGVRSYVFAGQSIPARPGGLIVSLYRVVGRSCAAGVEPSACPGEVFLGQARADASTGRYRIPLRFAARDQGVRAAFVVKTGRDAQNAPGRSNVRSLLIF